MFFNYLISTSESTIVTVLPQVIVKSSQFRVERGRVLTNGLDVVAKLGEEISREMINLSIVLYAEAGVAVASLGELGLDVVDDLLDGVDGFVAVDDGGEVSEAVVFELGGQDGLRDGGDFELEVGWKFGEKIKFTGCSNIEKMHRRL